MSRKNLDNKNRWRSVTVGFRMSPEEAKELDDRVKLCGMQKQEYLIQSALNQQIVVAGHKAMYDTFREHLEHIGSELQRIEKVSEMEEELLTPLRTILEIMAAVNRKEGEKHE